MERPAASLRVQILILSPKAGSGVPEGRGEGGSRANMRMDRTTMRQAGWGVALLVTALLFIFGNQLLGMTVDWLWFGEVGQRRVFWTILAARAQLALLFGVAFFLLTFLNVWIARRASPPLTPQ